MDEKLSDISENTVEAAAENLVTHAGWVHRRAKGMRVDGEGGLVIIDSGLPCDTFNFVLRARLSESTASARIASAIRYFEDVNRPFSWWVGPGDAPSNIGDLLTEAGLEKAETELAMCADLSNLPALELAPGGLRIERVRDERQLHEFAAINAANWTPPDVYVIKFYKITSQFLLAEGSPMWLYIGYLDGMPVATSELTIGGGVAGLYNICTLVKFRQKGIGTAMTLKPLLDVRAIGIQSAVLQAAPDGINVYKQVGFREFGQITEFKPGPKA